MATDMNVREKLLAQACHDCVPDLRLALGGEGLPPVLAVVHHPASCPWAQRHVREPEAVSLPEVGVVIHVRHSE